MRELMISYHPVKKEIRFFGKFKGEFVEIPYEDCPHLDKYGPGSGEFLLQNQGTQFFDDIWEQFSKDNVNITFKGTKIDYEDIQKKIADYNQVKEKQIFKIIKFIELPNVSEIYECIGEFCDEVIDTFEKELEENETKIIFRKKYYVVYLKEGACIVDLLNVCEAPVSLMKLENLRILKEMRNSVNRRVNCETANIAKTVNAASRQMEDIEYLEVHYGFQNLPESLQQMAEIRLEHPDMSLKELGECFDPPIGKSGVNHRLRKLSELADKLRG